MAETSVWLVVPLPLGGGHAEALQRWGHLPPECGGSRTPDESPGQHVTQVPSDKSLRMPPKKVLKTKRPKNTGGTSRPVSPRPQQPVHHDGEFGAEEGSVSVTR